MAPLDEIELNIKKGFDGYESVDLEEAEVKKLKCDEDDKAHEVEELAGFDLLSKYVEPDDYAPLAMAVCMAFLTGCSQPAQLVIFGNVLDAFNNSEDPADQVSLLAILYCVVGTTTFITASIGTRGITVFAANVTRRLRKQYFESLVRKPVSFFDLADNDPSLVAVSVMGATNHVAEGLGEKSLLGFQMVISFFVGYGVALYYCWQLALLLMGVLPLVAIIIGMSIGRLAAATAEADTKSSEASSGALEVLGAVRTLFALGLQPVSIDRYDSRSEKAATAGIRRFFAQACVIASVVLCMYCTYSAGLYFGAYLIWTGMEARTSCTYYLDANEEVHYPEEDCVSGGDVMICFFSVLFGGLNILQASPAIGYVNQMRRSLFKIAATMSAQGEVIDPLSEDGLVPSDDAAHGKLELRDVKFAYPARPEHDVYSGVNISFEAGQTVALVGPSGCGKSTVVSLVERFYDPREGGVYLDGHDLRSLRVSWLRSQIGMVGQEPTLFTGSILDNIKQGKLDASTEDVHEAARMANAYDFVSAFPDGFNTQVGEKGIQLSGGQKQRIAIARAIIRDPKILILDEATSALDSTSERVVQEALDKLLAAKRRTTIVIAHRLSTVKNADKIVVLSDGAVVEEGTHDALMASNGTYATLVAMQTSSMKGENSRVSSSAALDGLVDASTTQGVSCSGDDKNGSVGCKDEGLALTSAELTTEAGPQAEAVEVEVEVEVDPKTEQSATAWIWSLTEKDRWLILPVCLGIVLNGGSFPLIGYFLSEMIALFFNPDTDEMRKEAQFWALMFIVLAVATATGNFLSTYCFGIVTEHLAKEVRQRSFRQMLCLDVEWYDRPENSAGTISQRLTTDSMSIKAIAGERAATSATQMVTLCVSLGVAFYFCWEMTLVMLGLFPLIGTGFAIQHVFVTAMSKDSTDATNDAGALASQSLLNIRTVCSLTMERQQLAKFSSLIEIPYTQFVRKGTVTGMGMGFSQFVILSGAGLAYYCGGQLVKAGRTDFASIMAVILAMMFGAVGLGQVAADASDKAEAFMAAKRIMGLLAIEPQVSGLSEDGLVPSDDAAHGKLELRDVKFAYPARPEHDVYSGVNISFEAGQTVALVGPSGCGKSTVVSLVERFYDPREGGVYLDGHDLRSLRVSWLRSQIGMVGQEPTLFTGSILDNIKQGKLDASTEDVHEAARMANAYDFVSAFPDGFNTQVGEKGIQLSGGQKQRIAIARAIIRDPKILILDEATSALDSTSERVVQEALDKLLAAKRRTTIVIAHRLSTVKNADKIVVLSDGAVVEEGTHDALIGISGGHYAALALSAMH